MVTPPNGHESPYLLTGLTECQARKGRLPFAAKVMASDAHSITRLAGGTSAIAMKVRLPWSRFFSADLLRSKALASPTEFFKRESSSNLVFEIAAVAFAA